MEDWEVILESYPLAPDVRLFTKALRTAELELKGDLAPFESEWIINTLCFKPVNLFETVSSNCQDTPWSKPICDAFKLLGYVVEKFPAEHLYENIVTLCLLPYTPQIRKDALQCLTKLARLSREAARDWSRLVSELSEAATGKAPLAVLVGTLAEHHPELVTSDVNRVWRLYLNMLASNKNTDTVISSVLQGLCGLFKHFGQDLPIIEFRDLYTKLSKEYVRKSGCEKVSLYMLESYSDLFKELLSDDRPLRDYLWSLQHSAAITSVYKALATAVTLQKLQTIIDTELIPRTKSRNSEQRHTALRIVKLLASVHNVSGHTDGFANVQVFEHELRSGNVAFEAADAILWCIESNALYSDKLLQTAILYFNNIPSSKRTPIVVHGLLNSPEDVRTAATTLLITESCQLTKDTHNIEHYLPLWKDLLDSKGGKDTVVLEKAKYVFADVMEYLFTVLEAVLDEEHETLPEKLSPLLTLAYHVLTIHLPEQYTERPCTKLLRLLRDAMSCGITAPLISAVVAASKHCGGDLAEYCKLVRVDKCLDEAVLCEACHLLVQADGGDVDVTNVLQALEILFSRKNVDPTILSAALMRFENIMNEHDDLERERVDYIVHLVDNLRSLKDTSSKEARILHRDVIIFLGKCGNDKYVVKNSKENTVIAKLKDKLLLNLPNTEEGITYKLNVQRILHMAVVYEDSDALQKLLAIICVTLSSKADSDLQLALTTVIRSLCRSHAHSSSVDVAAVQHAVLLCRSVDCVGALLTAISSEKSPGARKMLSDALEGSLLVEPGSEDTEVLIRAVADEAAAMMRSGDPTSRSGGLSITETLISALKDNHALQKSILPDLLTLILETDDMDAKNTFQNASQLLLDNLQIYENDIIKDINLKLVESVLKSRMFKTNVDVKLFKDKVRETACFLIDVKQFENEEICVERLSDDFQRVLCFMAIYKMELIYDVIVDILEKIAEFRTENERINSVFEIEAVLKFLEEYCYVLIEKNQEMSIKAVGNILKNLSPNNILCLQKQIKSCVTVYKKHMKPKALKDIYINWCRKFSINDVISNISVNDIHSENSSIVKAIVIYADLLDVIVGNDCMLQLCDTVLDIYVNNEERYIDSDKEYLSDLLCLSLRLHTVESIKNFVRTTHEKSDMRFLKYFVDVFSKYFLKKPFLLMDGDLKYIAVIMKYVLKATLKKRYDNTHYERLLELLDKIWPVLSSLTSFEEKCEVLTLASRLPIQLPATSAPIQWAIEESTAGRDIGDTIRLVAVLPGGEECGASYRSLASKLPVRLSELSNCQHSALQALLDALATTGDTVALDIVTKLADCDPTKGWWDEALASSMGSLARGDCLKHGSLNALTKAEDNSASLMSIAKSLFEIPSHGVCHRLLIPLLRYSSSSFCEQFYASTINKLLAALNAWPRDDSRASETQLLRILKEQARALALITLAFEKIPVPSLKSSDSPLYAQVVDKQPSYLLRRACALCYQLRTKTIPEDASEELKMCYSQCLVENFKCFCGAVCISRPADKLYDCVFNPRVWEAIVCKDTVHTLPIHSEWNKRRTLHSIAVDIPSEARTGTLHTRMFLRTLSVDPLQYDLLQPPGQEDNALELELPINTLNCQECAAPLTSLVTHAASLARYQWRHTLCDALVGSYHRNLKWTIAQVIYNCKDSLSGHADALRPALLQMVADTACGDGTRTLNGLHVNALEIVLQWQDSTLPETSLPHLTSTIEYLINTTMDNAHRPSVFSSLLSLLGKLTELYGGKELVWNGFNEHLSVPSKLKPLLSILLVITKRKIRIPELLPALSQLNPTYWSHDQKLAELFGHALACESERGAYLIQHRKFLARKTEGVVFVRNVFNTQKGYPRFVDEAIFKTITDMTPKLMRTERAHCLKILATYVEHASEVTDTISDMFETIDICSLLQDSSVDAMLLVKHGCRMMGDRLKRKVMSAVAGYCENSDPKVRKMAFEVALKVFEDLFKPKHSEPSAKKFKSISSSILTAVDTSDTSKVIECVARGVTDCVTSIASDVTEGVAACLSTSDMNIRLAESFLIALSIPATQKHQDLSICVAAFLELLFKGMRSQPRFQDLKLREEPLEIREPATGPSKLLTKSRTYHGTFLSTTRRLQKRKEPTSAGINVQVAIDDILRTMTDFAKHKPDAAQALCVQTIKCVLHRAGPGFDAGAALSRQICDVLSAAPSDVHPLAVELGRLLVDRVCGVPGFQNSLDKLRRLTKCTEGEPPVTLLYEDALLRGDDEIFVLGLQKYETTSMDVDSHATPTLEGIMSAFGKLSNWDRLTIQAKTEVMRGGIPQLWVDGATFRSWLDGYEVNNTTTWFNKLVATCRDECKQDSLRWLRETDRWPRRHFHISTVAEAIQRSSDLGDDIKLPCDISPSDCLAEWAARLMLGKAYSPSYQESSEEISLKYDQELLWCKVANDRQLPHLVINCVDVHSGGLDATQVLPWRIERARAMRSIGLDSGNSDILRETLSLLESSQIQVLDTDQDVIAMNKLILALHLDLRSLTKEKVTNTIDIIERNTDRQTINKNNKQTLCSVYELAMNYYDDVWPEEVTKCELLSNMADVLARVIELDLRSRAEMLLSIILNRLDEMEELDEDTARNVLDKISIIVRNLDEFSLEAVRKNAGLFPAQILAEYSQVIAATSRSDDEERYRRQLQLICDPRHSLQQRCAKLLHINDPSEWKATFDLLKVNIFENPYAKNSTEYSLLTKYRDSLYQIEKFENTERTQRVATLNKVLQDLLSRVTERATLRLSQLCPALTRLGDRDGCLARLLRLGRLGVVKIYEQVSVFTNAITRPVVIKVLLTDGTVRHFITKGGESLRLDAAAQAAARAAARLTGAEFQGYSVTPLGEDGGLIEYLEGTTTFRDLISSEHDLDAMAERLNRFIVSSSPMEKYRTYCNQIPPYTFRSAVEKICSSVEDFIAKKQSFLETLSSLTLFGSLLGLGDRHLENFLYLPHNGNACCVDWASALQYGRGELPPARLTRNVLGLAQGEDVEARLQAILKSLRGARILFLNVLKLSFKWMGPEFLVKYNYMKLFLVGEATTFDITEMCLTTSEDRHRHKDSLKVLREVFAGESKKTYTVVEQISCLLKQSTHPRILSITREGWESHI